MSTAAAFLKAIERSGAGGASARGLESTSSAALPATGELIDRLRAEIDWIGGVSGARPDKDLVVALAAAGKDGLDRLNADGADAHLDDRHLGGLEAVIRTDGSRPVAFVRDDFVDVSQPSLQGWPGLVDLGDRQDRIMHACRATGRVDDPSQKSLGYQGTAFVIAGDLVMTNRHVLVEITRERDADIGTLKDDISIDFRREIGAERTDRRFKVTEIVFRGSGGDARHMQAETGLNFDGLDIAVLRVALDGRTLADPLPLVCGDAVTFAVPGRRIFIVGFPGSTAGLSLDLFDSVFSGVKAFKRMAPGEILDAAGTGKVGHDPRNWTMTHDASTLGGNSGSLVWDFESLKSPLLGIHFAGQFTRQNWAHSFERLGDALGPLGLPTPHG